MRRDSRHRRKGPYPGLIALHREYICGPDCRQSESQFSNEDGLSSCEFWHQSSVHRLPLRPVKDPPWSSEVSGSDLGTTRHLTHWHAQRRTYLLGSVLRSYSASNTLARSMEKFICVCTCIEYPLLNAAWDDECTTWLTGH